MTIVHGDKKDSLTLQQDFVPMNLSSGGEIDAPLVFAGYGSRYVDDVRSWQSSEPALDMTGSAILGAALQESLACR